jgi:hypothetical protein
MALARHSEQQICRLLFNRSDSLARDFPLDTIGNTGLLAQSLAADALLAGLAYTALQGLRRLCTDHAFFTGFAHGRNLSLVSSH